MNTVCIPENISTPKSLAKKPENLEDLLFNDDMII